MSACYPYNGGPHCGTHCSAISRGNPCVLEPHEGDVHIFGTPPCDPTAAIKYARAPAGEPLDKPTPTATFDGCEVNDLTTGHRWKWSAQYQAWADMGPIRC